jgi:hypothetical protein
MKNLNKDIFTLDETGLNRRGLYAYALNIGENLGVEYVFVEYSNGEKYETSEFALDENRVMIPSRFIDENLTERAYRATKGAIDHETAHVLWPDPSYLPDNNTDDEDREIIWDIGNMIDDIRIEHRMVREYQVDANNFRYLKEKLLAEQPDLKEEIQNNPIYLIDLYLNNCYRKIDNSYSQGIKVTQDFAKVLTEEIAPVIDRFIDSDEKAGDTAREILRILRSI